ncbi:hypothetical protein JCM10212_002706 [Sporobolomyces blumeae]
MDEDSPWGAPSSSPPASSLPTFARSSSSTSPRLDSPPSPSFANQSTPSWGIDDGGGWGNAVDDEYGSFGTGPASGTGLDEAPAPGIELDTDVPRKASVGDAWGTTAARDGPASPPLPRFTVADTVPTPMLDAESPFDHGDDLQDAPTTGKATTGGQVNDGVDDGRGWQPATPPLPPIQSLHLSEPSSPKDPAGSTSVGQTRSATWDPDSMDDDFAEPVPALPSVQDLFPSSRNSPDISGPNVVGDGEEAWGAAQGWEERQEKERRWEEEEREEIERKVREAQEAAERGEESWGGAATGLGANRQANSDSVHHEEDTSRAHIVRSSDPASAPDSDQTSSNPSALPSLFRLKPTLFPKLKDGLSRTAAKPNDDTTDSGTADHEASQAGAGGSRVHAGDEFDLDAPGRSTGSSKGSSWWGGSRPAKEDHEEPASAGHETKAAPADGEHAQPAGAFGRLLNRFKKNPNAANSTSADGGGSNRSSAEAVRTSGSQTREEQLGTNGPPQFKAEDFDALGSGQFGRSTMTQHPSESRDIDEDEDLDPVGGFFSRGGTNGSERPGFPGGSGNSRIGSFGTKSRSRVPTAPPEDDFGGLLGAFSTAPTASTSRPHPKTSKSYDPFDPLANDPTPVAAPPANTLANFGPRQPPAPPLETSKEATSDDSFDAFFDSVTSSIPARPLSSVPTPPLPSLNQHRPSSLILPSTKTASVASRSPVPRIASPPRPRTISPVSASGQAISRSSTPIMPLAPPPPPSQPLAQRNNLLGSLGSPPPPTQPVSSNLAGNAAKPPPITTSTASVLRPQSVSPPPSAMFHPSLLAPTKLPSPSVTPPPPSLSPARPQSRPQLASTSRPGSGSGSGSGPLSRDDLSFFENL